MKYFGTDGIRGDLKKINFRTAIKIGKALGSYIKKNKLSKYIVVGMDTRNSSSMLVATFIGAITESGINVTIAGIVPTPVVSYIVSNNSKFSVGVMITASHNLYYLNGFKFFSASGLKFTIEEETELEKFIEQPKFNATKIKGIINYNENYIKDYENFIYKNSINMEKYKLFIDMANGAEYKLASKILSNLKPDIYFMSIKPNGLNINKECGAVYPEILAKKVVKNKCDIGFAFDGDGDRLRVVLNNGRILNNDELFYILIQYLRDTNQLEKDVVGTILTNYGLEKTLLEDKINLIRVDVGDRNIVQMLKKKNLSLGVESSGHFCLYKYCNTCDALFNAIYFMKIFDYYNGNLENILKRLNFSFQYEITIPINNRLLELYNDKDEIIKIINMYKHCRIILRPSGTEPIFRIVVESFDQNENIKIANEIAKILKSITL